MISIVPLNKINNTTEVINKSSIICNSHAQKGNYESSYLFLLQNHCLLTKYVSTILET